MIKSADKFRISDIFSLEHPVKYVIPKFQREYTWGKNEWENLYDDIIDSEDSHFLGSIICVDVGQDALSVRPLEVIDGQQRLTTFSILNAAIYHKIATSEQDDEDYITEKNNLKNRLLIKGEGKAKLELSSQNNNNNDYLSILCDIGLVSGFENQSNQGNRRIYKAFRYFEAMIEEMSYAEIVNLINKINRALLVKIEVDNHSDAFILFESLNNRGVPLSPIDLIKNQILSAIDRSPDGDMDTAFERWKGLVNNLSDEVAQERFLRQYYNAFKSREEIKVQNIVRATRSSMIRIYQELIKRDVSLIFDDLCAKAAIYHDLTNPQDARYVKDVDKIASELIDLQNIKAAPAYTLLLYLFSSKEEMDTEFYRGVLVFLSKYFARRSFTDFPATRNLDQIFIDLIQHIEESDNLSLDTITNFLQKSDKCSDLESLRNKLSGDVYELNVDATRYLLTKIEQSRSTNEIHTDFWERDKSNKLKWTIEHIFPEGKNIPQSWVEMIAEGDGERAVQIQEECVHKLGNLTLTGYNQSLSNFDFQKKRDRKDSGGNYIGYKNHLLLNEGVANKDSWSQEDISKRTEELVNLALEEFRFVGE